MYGCLVIVYHSEFAVGSANIREGGVPTNPENGVVARSGVGSSFPIHQTAEKERRNPLPTRKSKNAIKVWILIEIECWGEKG